MNLGELMLYVKADTSQAEAGLNKIKQAASALTSLGTTLSVSVTAPLLALGGAALTVASSMEQTRVAFTTMLGSAEKADAFIKQLYQFARTTPFEIGGISDAARKLMAYGFAASEVIPILENVGDAVAALGGNQEHINRITIALGQMQAAGKVNAQDMRQLTEVGLRAWDMLARKLNVDVATAMSMVTAGTVDAATGLAAIREGIQRTFGGASVAQMETFAGKWSNFKDEVTLTLAALGVPLITVAKSALAALTPLLEWVKKAAEWFSRLPKPVQQVVIILAALAAAIGPLLIVLGSLLNAITVVSTAMKAFHIALNLTSLVSLFTNPIGIILVAVAALVAAAYLVVKNWDTIKEFFQDLWENVKTTFSRFVTWARDLLLNWTPLGLIIKHWDGLAGWFGAMWERVRGIFGDAVDWLKDKINGWTAHVKQQTDAQQEHITRRTEEIRQSLLAKWEEIRATVSAKCNEITENMRQRANEQQQVVAQRSEEIRQTFINKWTEIKGFLYEVWNNLSSKVYSWLTGQHETVQAGLANVWAAISERWTAIKGFLYDVWNNLYTKVSSWLTSQWEAVTTGLLNVWTAINERWTAIKGFLYEIWANLYSKVSSWLSSQFEATKSGLANVWTAISERWTAIKGFLYEIWANLYSKVSSWLSSQFEAVKSGLANVSSSVQEVWTNIKGFLYEVWSNLVSKVTSWGTSTWEAIKSTFGRIWQAVVTLWTDIVTKFQSGMGTVVSTITGYFGSFYNVGHDIIANIISGIQSMWNRMVEAVTNVANKILSKIKEILGIQSPSKALFNVGTSLVDGLINGIKGRIPSLDDVIQGMVGGITGGVASILGAGVMPGTTGVAGNPGRWLQVQAAASLNRVLSQFPGIGVTSAGRTAAQQAELVRRYGLYSQGGRAAPVGSSYHEAGAAVDLANVSAQAAAALRAAGWQNNVPREPWHWNYTPITSRMSPQAAIAAMRAAGQASGQAYGEGTVQGVRDSLQMHSPSRVLQLLGEEAGESFLAGLGNSVNYLEQLFMSSFREIGDSWEQLLGIPRVLSKDAEAAWHSVTAAVTDTVSSIQAAWATLSSLPETLSSLWASVRDIGENLFSGLLEGITGVIPSIFDTVGGAVQDIIDLVKGLLGIRSPSDVFEDIGEDVVSGLEAGLEDLPQVLADTAELPTNVFAAWQDTGEKLAGELVYGLEKGITTWEDVVSALALSQANRAQQLAEINAAVGEEWFRDFRAQMEAGGFSSVEGAMAALQARMAEVSERAAQAAGRQSAFSFTNAFVDAMAVYVSTGRVSQALASLAVAAGGAVGGTAGNMLSSVGMAIGSGNTSWSGILGAVGTAVGGPLGGIVGGLLGGLFGGGKKKKATTASDTAQTESLGKRLVHSLVQGMLNEQPALAVAMDSLYATVRASVFGALGLKTSEQDKAVAAQRALGEKMIKALTAGLTSQFPTLQNAGDVARSIIEASLGLGPSSGAVLANRLTSDRMLQALLGETVLQLPGLGRNIGLMESLFRDFLSISADMYRDQAISPDLMGLIGEQLVQGLVEGLVAAEPRLAIAMQQLTSIVSAVMRQELGISSPSRVFFQYGVSLVEGLLNGMGYLAPRLDGTVAGIANRVRQAGRATVNAARGLGGAEAGMPATVVIELDGHVIARKTIELQPELLRMKGILI